MGDEVLPEIIKNLKNANNDIRYWSIQVLKRLGRTSYKYLLKDLDNLDIESKLYAIYALGELKQKEALDVLQKYLNYPDEWIKKAALEAIISIDFRVALNLFFELLKNTKEETGELDTLLGWLPRKINSLADNIGEALLDDFSWETLNYRQKRFWLDLLFSQSDWDETLNEKLWKVFALANEREYGIICDAFLKKRYTEDFFKWFLDLVFRNKGFKPCLKKYITLYEDKVKSFLKELLSRLEGEKKSFVSELL
jgi:hypothetical protein